MGRTDRIRPRCGAYTRRTSAKSSRDGRGWICRPWRRIERPRRRAASARDCRESSAPEVGFAHSMMTRRRAIAISVCALSAVLLSSAARSQWSGRDGWVEEPAAKSLNIGGGLDHSYLEPASVHRGDDGLIYFNESSGVTKPE